MMTRAIFINTSSDHPATLQITLDQSARWSEMVRTNPLANPGTDPKQQGAVGWSLRLDPGKIVGLATMGHVHILHIEPDAPGLVESHTILTGEDPWPVPPAVHVPPEFQGMPANEFKERIQKFIRNVCEALKK
jgi:hypothetical protein